MGLPDFRASGSRVPGQPQPWGNHAAGSREAVAADSHMAGRGLLALVLPS